MIHIETSDGIATWTWDAPGRDQNLFDQASLDAFDAAIRQASADPAIRGIIVTSGKDAFCAGGDLKMFEQLSTDPAVLTASAGALSAVLRRLETCGKPVVAAINGTAVGGGFELALACHRRIVADKRSLRLGLPEATLGLLPAGGGTQRIPRMIGIQPSLMLLLEGKTFRASEFLALGLVDEIVPPESLLSAARNWLDGKPVATKAWDQKNFKVPGGGPDDPTVAQTFMVGTAMYAAKTFGNLPGGRAILSCVSEGLRLPFDAGLKVETRYFVSLLVDPVARSMIRTLFVHLGEANRLARRPAGVPKADLRKIGVLGAGLMGAGIAHVAAKAGLQVVLVDVDATRAANGRIEAGRPFDRPIQKGTATEADRQAVLDRILATTDFDALDGCGLVVEAVFADRAVTADVTRKA